jgi:hypothetical protein
LNKEKGRKEVKFRRDRRMKCREMITGMYRRGGGGAGRRKNNKEYEKK